MAVKKKRTTSRRTLARRRGKYAHEQVLTPLDIQAIRMREFYLALRRAGFPSDIAMGLIADGFPDWAIPKTPQFDPVNPDQSPFEEEE